ncbi:MAG: OmpH family outer membrane protein [Burkholderiales bacterium]
MKFLSASALLLVALSTQAQDLKIGYVNRDKVFSKANIYKDAEAKFKAEFAGREKELKDLELKLKGLADRFEKDAQIISESERGRRQRELVELEREMQRKRRAFQEDVAQRQQEEIAILNDRAGRIIQQIFESEKFDLILTQDAVSFVSARVDITDKVIKALNAQSGK